MGSILHTWDETSAWPSVFASPEKNWQPCMRLLLIHSTLSAASEKHVTKKLRQPTHLPHCVDLGDYFELICEEYSTVEKQS